MGTNGSVAGQSFWSHCLTGATVAMALALVARVLFIAINSTALSVPWLAQNATTVAALVTSISYPVIIAANAYLLNERLSGRQYVGAALIMTGVMLAFSRGASS